MIPERDHDGRSRPVKRAEVRDIEASLKGDFRVFLHAVWKHLGLPAPTPVQLDIAHYMQHGPRRKMVQAFRGVGKTWVYGAFVAWCLYVNPDEKILVISGTKQLADDFSKFVKNLIGEMPILAHLKPRDGQRNSDIRFDVGPAKTSKDPSVKSVGITGQITGSRASIILADDVESLNNSATEGSRLKLSEAVKEFDAVLKPNGSITYLGTPQTAMTMYAKLPERGYDIRVWPARVPKDPDAYNGRLAPYITRLIAKGIPSGTPVDPKRFNDDDLQERELSYGRTGFALQFLLDTSLNDSLRFPLKLSDLIVMPLDSRCAPTRVAWGASPDKVVEGVTNVGLPGDRYYRPVYVTDSMADFSGSVLVIDPSGRGADETAYAVTKHLMGSVFLADAGAIPGGYQDETLDSLVKIATRNEVNKVIIESNFGDGMFTKLFQSALQRAKVRMSVEEVRHSKQKELRIIDTLEPVMQSHRLIVNERLINADYASAPSPEYGLFWQMARITKDRGSLRKDDRLDALAMAVAYWTAQMATDQEKAHETHNAKAIEKELRDFVKHALGHKHRAPRWGVTSR